jgi:two-component system sensor kinase FixL
MAMKFEPSTYAPSAPVPGAVLGETVAAIVFDLTEEGFMVVDAGGRVLAANAAAERLLGQGVDALRGLQIDRILETADGKRPARPLQLLARGGASRWRMPDGRHVSLAASAVAVDQASGRCHVVRLSPRDATLAEQVRIERLHANLHQIARVSTADAMGGAIAHELNQPLTALSLYLRTLERVVARPREDAAAQSHDLSEITRKALGEAQRAADILRRMRSVIEQRAPVREWIDLNRAVEESIDLTMVGRDTQVSVLRRYATSLPLVHADRVQIQQVVVNLVRNAFEALRDTADPEVVVATSVSGGNACVHVSDNGPGLPSAKLTDLFKPFESSKADGLGLGLAISRAIAQNHGGNLALDPEGSRIGAAFTLTIPLGSPERNKTGE